MESESCYLPRFFPLISFLPFSHLAGVVLPCYPCSLQRCLGKVFHNHLAEGWLLEFFTLGAPLFQFWIKNFCELKKEGESRLFFSVFWKQFHRGLPLVGMFWFQRWFEKLLDHIAASPSSVSSLQLVLCRALRGNGMSKVPEIHWGEKKTNWKKNQKNVTFVPKENVYVISALGRTINPYSGARGNFWPLNCWEDPEDKVYSDCHSKSWFLDTSLNKSCSYT